MSLESERKIAVIGIVIGKNSFHLIGPDDHGAIVLRQKWSRDRSDHLECDRAIREISKRGNRYLRVRFVQTAWAVLVWAQSWERHGLKPWTEAAKKRPP